MSALFGNHAKLKWQDSKYSWYRRHSLSLFLGGLTLFQTIAAVIAYWYVWRNGLESFKDGTGVDVFIIFFLAVYLTSIVADSYGALIQVLSTKWFYEEGSAQSKQEDKSK